MPRRQLKPGEAGDFSEPKWREDRSVWQVSCKIGEHMGRPSRLYATGPTKRKAIDSLKNRVAAWKPKAATLGAYSPNCTVAEAADAWLVKFEQHPRTKGQTAFTYRKEIYRSSARNANPKKIVIAESDLGRMKASEVQPFHIRLHLASLNGFSTKQFLHKVVLSHIFEMLVEDGARDYNPVTPIKGYNGDNGPKQAGRRKKNVNPYFPDEPSPFTSEELSLFRELESRYFSPENCRSHRRDPRFLDFTMLVYDLAARPSEALALRWQDINLTTGEVQINATVVVARLRVWQIRKIISDFELAANDIVTREITQDVADDALMTATYRQPFGKTRESAGSVIVTSPTLAMLRRRSHTAAAQQQLVFPTQTGNLLRSSVMSEAWQRVVSGTELKWSTPKTLRSTRATRVAERHGLPAARLMLRHQENSPVTAANYVPRTQPTVNFTDAL